MPRPIPSLLLFAAAALSLASPHAAAQQSGAILIWPVHPVIEGEAGAAALWIENPGKAPITLQARIFAWSQESGKNVYAAQDELLATPPIVTIDSGARQLVRLTRTAPPPSEAERAYRLIVDELPVESGDSAAAGGATVTFRMRYSLPLFSYARGAGPKALAARKTPQPAPRLSWSIGRDAEGAWLKVRNSGAVHARLTDVAFGEGAARHTVAAGLLGYVLPGREARWPLAGMPVSGAPLILSVNGAPAGPIAPKPE